MRHLFGILLALAWVGTSVAALPPKDEQQFREQMGLDEYGNVAYRNIDGSSVAFDQFYDIVASGQPFSMMKDDEKSIAIITVMDKNQMPEPEALLIKRGERMPEPTLRDLDGHSVELHARGQRPLLMNFFFAACAPCIAEIPALNEFKQQHPDIDVVAVTFDEPSEARRFIAKHGFDWPIVANGEEFKNELGIESYPTFAYVGKDGKVLEIARSSVITGNSDFTAATLAAWVGTLQPR